jgi:hypothetical protein
VKGEEKREREREGLGTTLINFKTHHKNPVQGNHARVISRFCVQWDFGHTLPRRIRNFAAFNLFGKRMGNSRFAEIRGTIVSSRKKEGEGEGEGEDEK